MRRFHQDDAHIFCTPDQIFTEIIETLNFLRYVYYNVFKFPEHHLMLSTRPKEKYIGTVEEWDNAETALKQALEESQIPWTVNEGDGAFYGPKIDVMVKDALGRQHQTATIQLDMQLPARFSLYYQGSDGKQHQPIIIHRAIYGSLERMLAILLEHFAGKLPLWLSPRQVLICAAKGKDHESISNYATTVQNHILEAGRKQGLQLFIDVNTSSDTLPRKIREGTKSSYNFIAIVGEKEAQEGTVSIRQRDGQQIGTQAMEDFTRHLLQAMESRD